MEMAKFPELRSVGNSATTLLEIIRMAAPAIALRYRDTTPNVDTIQAHRELIDNSGAVWWGWWKKEFEEDCSDMLSALSRVGLFELLIVNRTTKEMFAAKACCWSKAPPPRETIWRENYQYYRKFADSVFGWFLLTSISRINYEEEVGRQFDDRTLVVLAPNAKPAQRAIRAISGQDRTCVLHLSDLHFGADYGFLPPQGIRGLSRIIARP